MPPAPLLEVGQARLNWRRWALGLLLLAAIVAVALHFAQIEQFGLMLRQAQPIWLLAALGLQVSTYIFVAAGWRAVLRAGGSAVSFGDLSLLALGKLFADQALPAAGMSGNVLTVDRLISRGAPRGLAAAALIVSTIAFYLGLALFGLAALLILWLHHEATRLLIVTVAVFMVVAIAIPAAWIWLSRRGARPLPTFLARIGIARTLFETLGEAPPELVRDRKLIAKATLFNGLVVIADAATLSTCLLALGQPAAAGAAFVAVAIAQMVSLVVLVPLGLGAFEGSCVAMLHLLGVGLEPAIAATLLLRGFTLWLPMLPGLWVVRHLARSHAETRRRA